MSDEGEVTDLSERVNDPDGNLLASLAILSVNASDRKLSYLDHFVPFAVEALASDCGGTGSSSQVAKSLKSLFGLVIPISVVHDILKRAQRQSKVTKTDEKFTVSEGAERDRTSFQSLRNEVLRKQVSLADKLKNFVQSKYGTAWTQEEAEQILQEFVGKMSAPLMRSILNGSGEFNSPGPSGSDVTSTYILGDFITIVTHDDPEAFTCLESMVKGSMLASGLYIPGAGESTRKFKNTIVWLDTPIALQWLGLEGVDAALYVATVLELAEQQGAQLGIFTHSLIEMRSVVMAAADGVRRLPNNSRHLGVLAHFRAVGITYAEGHLLASSLEEKISNRGVIIQDAPDHQERYGIDEVQLEQKLQDIVGYASRNTMRCDLDSLTAIYRSRRGFAPNSIENCRAVLLTDNDKLVSASSRFFELGKHGWPLAVLDDEVASLLWSKRPMDAPDMPRNQMIANALAALQPDPELWTAYNRELDRLITRQPDAADSVTLLRHSTEARKFLMEETLGDSLRVTPEVIDSILGGLVEPELVPMRAELLEARNQRDEESAENQRIREQLAAFELRDSNNKSRIIKNSARQAIWLGNAVRAVSIVLALCMVISILHLRYPKIPFHSSWIGNLIGGLATIFTLTNVLIALNGHSLFKFALISENWLQKRIQRNQFRKLELNLNEFESRLN